MSVKLSDITEKTLLVKDFVARLKRTTKQAIPIVNVEKIKRVSGASARPVRIALENGQVVMIYLRVTDDHFDIFRIDINGKSQPLSGDFDNSYKPVFNASVDMIANTIKTSQAAFTKKLAQKRVKPPSNNKTIGRAPQNKSQQRNALLAQEKELDVTIEQKQTQISELEQQLEQMGLQADLASASA